MKAALLLILALAACTACETTTPAQRTAEAKTQAKEFVDMCISAYETGLGKPREQWTAADKAGFQKAYLEAVSNWLTAQQARFEQQEQTDQIVTAIKNMNNYYPFQPSTPQPMPIIKLDDSNVQNWGNGIYHTNGKTYFPDGHGGYIAF